MVLVRFHVPQLNAERKLTTRGLDLPRAANWLYKRIALLVPGLLVIYLGAPVVYSLLDVEMDGAGGWIQFGLMACLIAGFAGYLAATCRGTVDG